jgi:hypothetical protein
MQFIPIIIGFILGVVIALGMVSRRHTEEVRPKRRSTISQESAGQSDVA